MARRLSANKDSKKLKVFAGRYAYVKPLGRGAGGSVYLAEDLHHHRRQVALKVLTPEACATVQGKMLRREFEILSKLDHPNLVRVYDYGSLPDGGVYLAEEYIDGFSLQDARALLSPESLIELTMQILNGLSYVHGMGMIHRDIKPANVMLLWLDDETVHAQAKLVDFGLSSMDPKRDTLRGGTRSYMAPEIIRGEKGEPQSDLFSLGVTLYYALCGVLPFGPRAKDDPPPTEEGFRPPDPHRLNPEVPLTLSRFTMALLRQIKGIEFMDAGEAMQALARDIEGDDFSGGILANDMQVAAPQVIRGYFERGVILEQSRIQEDLVEQLTEEPRPAGSLFFLVVGPPQTGKSRLLHEISTSCKLQGRLVVKTQAKAGSAPWALLGQLVQQLWDLTRHRKSNPLEKYREDLNMLSRQATLPIKEEVLIRQQSRWLLSAFKDACSMLYDERLLLCIEDLHLADEPSLQFLVKWLERADSYERVDMIVTSCPSEVLEPLTSVREVQTLINEGLKFEDVRYFIRERLGVLEIPDAWMHDVAMRAQGLPSYLEEVCRHLVDHGILRRDFATRWTVNLQELELFTLPMSVQESVRRRLSNISAAGREILEVLTLSEEPLPWRMLRDLAVAGGETAEGVDRAIEMLKWRHLVFVQLEMSGRTVRLIHPAVRDVIGHMFSPEWAKALHRRLGQQLQTRWLEQGGQVEPVALHLFKGGLIEQAMILSGQASEVSPGPELEQRLAWFDRLDSSKTKKPQERIVLAFSYATMALRALKPTRARQSLERAAAEAEQIGSEWLMFQAYIQAAELALAVDDIEAAAQWVMRVQDALPVLRVQPRSSTATARLAMIQGQLGIARRELMLAQKRQEILGDIKGQIDTISLLAEIDSLVLDAESASQNLQLVYDLASEYQLTDRLGRALLAHARLLCEEGAFERSLKLLADALDAMQGGKYPETWIEILCETASVALTAGQIATAERRAIETLVMSRLLEHKSLEAAATVMVAAVAVSQSKGDPMEHLERMLMAHERLTQSNLYPQLCICSAKTLAHTLAQQGRASEAQAFEREVMALRQTLTQRR